MRFHHRRAVVVCALAVLVCAAAWRRRDSEPAVALSPFTSIAATTPAPPAHAGTLPESLEVGGTTRTYLLHIPSTYNPKQASPLVVVLHGATESNDNVEILSRMSAKADQENFIAAYPEGTGRLPTWNSGNCCGPATKGGIDDIGFFRAMLERLERDYAIDRKRIYFTGISNGGMMSYRVACEMSDQVAAIAPVEGAQNVDCRPTSPVSVIIFHGTADHLVPFNGGSTPFQLGEKRTDRSVAYAVDFWVKRDSCSPAPMHEETTEVHIDKYAGCKDDTAIALYAIQRGHHMWPGVRISGNGVPATDLMWSFFAAHPKP